MPRGGQPIHARSASALPVATVPSVEMELEISARPGNLYLPWRPAPGNTKMANLLHNIRLDYVSCVLTILGTILLGRKLWQGWVVAAVNSAVVCVIGVRTAQFGFVPANLLCIALYTSNLVTWRFKSRSSRPILARQPRS